MKFVWSVFMATVRVLLYFAVAFAILYAALESYRFGYRVFSNPVYDDRSTEVITVEIVEGQSDVDVMRELSQKGVVQDCYSAYFRLCFSKYNGQLKPGSYEVSASMALDEILEALTGE